MKNPVLLAAGFLLLVSTAALAVTRGEPQIRARIDPPRPVYAPVQAGAVAPVAAAASTTFLATYTFDSGPSCVTEGWTGYDFTEQTHDFWHVAGTAELDGGDFGALLPLEGAQSMWCGADGPISAGADPVLCGYATLPGYGNNWDQPFCLKDCLTGAGGVVVNASVMWHSEPGYDATTMEVDNCDDTWTTVAGGFGVWDGAGSDTVSIAIPDESYSGDLRIRFRFQSDEVWSDQDGIYDSDGAFLIDELSVSDTSGVRVAYEDFEDETPGATESDHWQSCPMPGYGDFSALYSGYALVQEDPCQSELDCVWAFINGSTTDYACGGWPTQASVPYMNSRGQYIHNAVISPNIAVSGTGAVWELAFSVYRDLPFEPVVGYDWYVRTIDAAGCVGDWKSDIYVHNGGQKDWYRAVLPFGQFLDAGTTNFQVALGVRDVCRYWCGIYGNGTCHTHAPLFDDVEIYRIAADGPQWVLDDIDMFQDNFSEDGTITGPARADMAADILPRSSPGILPGDSVCVTVSDADNGLGFHVDGDPASGAAVYFYCHIDGPSAGAAAGALVVDSRYNHVGTVTADGRIWHQIQMDSAWTAAGEGVENRYNVDLNDNLFVPGDTVWFFFGAKNAPGVWSWSSLPLPGPVVGTADINEAAVCADEFTILPAGGYANGGEWLYVDGMNFRGNAQELFEESFRTLGEDQRVDRYDIRGPSEAVGNHPGSRVKNAATQLAGVYRRIVWNTGDLGTAFGDGLGRPNKSDDTGILYGFLENLPWPLNGGVYLNGDDVADMWLRDHTSASSVQLRTKYMTFGLVTADHVPTLGISPLVVGEPTGMFEDLFGVDTLVAHGGCPTINDFDVISAQGSANMEMMYHGNGNTAGAVVSDSTTNAVGNVVGFVLSGFSFHEIRDFRPMWYSARTEHLHRIGTWLGYIFDYINPGVDDSAARRYELAQNYPNPFNPVTTIRYQVETTGPATLRVYNVAGQLVRTLVDDTVEAGRIHEVRWRGLNDAGSPVASGVYFYRLVAGGFTQTKKMVLLQ
jgi:hypothetical protein